MSYQLYGESTDLEVARMLLEQAENEGISWACFKGASAFHLIVLLDLLAIFEVEKDGGVVKFCITAVRIFDYGGFANDEVGYSVTADGMIEDPDGVTTHSPETRLSLEEAPSGWEIHNLKPGYGEIVAAWLRTQEGG